MIARSQDSKICLRNECRHDVVGHVHHIVTLRPTATLEITYALGRLMPNGASTVGGFLVLAGCVMLGAAYYLSTH